MPQHLLRRHEHYHEVKSTNAEKPITFFEITSACFFLAAARTQADYTLLEVGLGGRLDSSNVMTPKLSVITSISNDHHDFLGDTLEKIAFEKAGIIKPNVPVIIGQQPHKEALDVFLRDQNINKQFFLSGGLDEDNIEIAIKNNITSLFDVSSSVESSPGVKDTLKIKQFIDKVKK